MKNYILPLLLMFLSYSSYSQSIKSKEILQKDCVESIGSIDSFDVFAGKQLRLGIFTASNGSGSANLPESDEVSFNLLVSVAHYDENPKSKIFSIGPFLNPKVTKKVDSGTSVTLFIEDGIVNKRKTTKVMVSEIKVQIE